jgi:hypothetical protein
MPSLLASIRTTLRRWHLQLLGAVTGLRIIASHRSLTHGSLRCAGSAGVTIEGSGALRASGMALIAVPYVAIPGFAEQTGKALRAFGPIAKMRVVSVIFLRPPP